MSVKIGIVSEGISDFQALKHIVERYLKEHKVQTIALQPKSRNGKQDGFGTWQGVFEYISGNDADKLIIEAQNEGCQFIIVQIDTDVCREYGVNGDTSDHNVLHNEVKKKLLNSFHSDFDKSKAIYAICIHELECWLLPFVCAENKCSIVNNCLNPLNQAIRTNGCIDKENKNCHKARVLYQHIFSRKKKPTEIKECAKHNFGFRSFIEQLDDIKAILEQESKNIE